LARCEAGEEPDAPRPEAVAQQVVGQDSERLSRSLRERGIRLLRVLRETKVLVGSRTAIVSGACVLLIGVAGCGEGEGVTEGASVTAYVEAPLCASAKAKLRSHGSRAGDLQVRAVCLSDPREAQKLNLAAVGSNARRATEDSTAVAYLEAPDPRAAPFTHRILETAEIPWISENSGAAAMSRLLKLIDSAGSGSLRKQLREDLNEP
jgi:hypothetical protein